MEKWYALSTMPGRELETAELIERSVDQNLWRECRIPKKLKVFRSGGILRLLEEIMFPGYLLIKTSDPQELSGELEKARKFPQLVGNAQRAIAPVETEDLRFLQDVCGKDLRQIMGVTEILLNEEKRIIRADGVLNRYLDQIVKLNLHKRFAVVEVELFNRTQNVLFGLRLNQDQMGAGNSPALKSG